MTPAQFVDTLNANAGNPLSPAERNQLVNDLSTNAKTRAQVLRAVAEDRDLVTAEFNRAFVLMQFFGYLRRNPNDHALALPSFSLECFQRARRSTKASCFFNVHFGMELTESHQATNAETPNEVRRMGMYYPRLPVSLT
jgi:hypothetical protein